MPDSVTGKMLKKAILKGDGMAKYESDAVICQAENDDFFGFVTFFQAH